MESFLTTISRLIAEKDLSLDDPEFSATVRKHGGETAIQRIQASILGGN